MDAQDDINRDELEDSSPLEEETSSSQFNASPAVDPEQVGRKDSRKEASAPADNDMYVKSLALATAVIKEFCTFTGAQPLGIVSLSDQTGFNYSDSPVIAIEMGCLSNEADDIRLNRAAYQDACAFGIYRGINQYAAMIESGDYDIASLLEGYSSDSESTKEK